MNLLGYVTMTGRYGSFKVPVFDLPDFSIPAAGTSESIYVTIDELRGFTFPSLNYIFGKVPDPPKNGPVDPTRGSMFAAVASPNVSLSPAYHTSKISGAVFPDDYVESIYYWYNNEFAFIGTWEYASHSIPAFFKIENKYYFLFSYDEEQYLLPEGTACRFVFFNSTGNFPIDNIFIGSKPKPTKFYLSSPKFGYIMRRGESVEIVFTEEYDDGTVVTPAPFEVLNKQPDKYGITNWTLSGNTLTITNECWNSYVFLATQPADSIVLTGRVDLTILDPTPPPSSSNPYLPPDGGISGGGNSSNISTVQGIFDADPGPSIVENLPVGSSGSDIASSGMYTKYLCNNALLNLLAEFFWEDNVGIQALKAVLGNPIDSIISLTAYPFALDTLVPKTSTTIYFGQYDSHFSAFSLTKSSFQIDWGSVKIPFFWGSFLDYSPYTKIQLYLPWGVGFVSIDPNEVVPWSRKNTYNKADFVDGTIRVITNIELDKGACVHNIIGNNGRIIGSFGGVVGKQVPVTGSDNSARILAMISAAVSSSAAIGTSAGGTLAAGKNLAYGKGMSMAERADGREMIGNYKSYVGNTVQSLSNALSSPPSYPRAGTFSDATNTLGYQYPYLIISRPSQSVPQQYGRFMGYPSNIFHNHLGEVRGYTEVSSIHLDNINATANELDELESILKGGVLL